MSHIKLSTGSNVGAIVQAIPWVVGGGEDGLLLIFTRDRADFFIEEATFAFTRVEALELLAEVRAAIACGHPDADPGPNAVPF